MPDTRWTRLVLSLAARAVLRPRVAADLVRVGWRFRRRDWWRQAPWLPIPATDYVRWRLYTAYGDATVVPPADDLIRYARWAVRGP